MSDLDVFQVFKAQYESIDGKKQDLADAIRQDVPVQEVSARLKQLAVSWDQAHLNYILAGNKIFDQNNAQIKGLTENLVSEQKSMDQALQNLHQIAKVLDQITSAVAIATSLVGIASTKVVAPIGA